MRKQIKKLLVIIIIAFFTITFYLYKNFRNNKMVVSSKANEIYQVYLSENNSNIITENSVSKIQKYNGNADNVIINKENISGEFLQIDAKAFLECNELESILIEKSLISENLKIENFEIDNNYQDEKYVQYNNTQEYSETYKRYLELSEEEKNKLEVIPAKYEVPISALYSKSMEENYNISGIEDAQIPNKFDLRDKINIKVENQGSTGTCYSYASLTSVETNEALIDNDSIDLSEVHQAALTDGYSGWFFEATNPYYANSIGPVEENAWPMEKILASEKDEITQIIYTYLAGEDPDITEEQFENMQNVLKETTAKKSVKETVNLPNPPKYIENLKGEVETIRKIIKRHIMEYGSLYAVIISDDIKDYNGTYVLNSNGSYNSFKSHAISIIGWDDNFAKENFPADCRPKNNGAYLALNSWGEEWGNNGCFWISYEDYWVEGSLSGVIEVNDISNNIGINSVKFKNIDTNEQILASEVIKGSNIQVEINTNINEVNENSFKITIISPKGEEVVNGVTISGNIIENNIAKILFDFNTKILEIGSYEIRLEYGDEIISRNIQINPNIFDYCIKDDGTITILGYYGDEINLVIPKEFLGYQITGMVENALVCNELESVTIYDNIIEIGKNLIDISTVIYGNKGSYIEQYANENGYTFISLDEDIIEGTGWYYDVNEHKLYISQNTEIGSYKNFASIIYKVEILSGVEEVLQEQFAGVQNLSEIILSDTIINIGYAAFRDCIKLEKINLPEKVTKIEKETFKNCSNLKEIEIPNGVYEIGSYSFYQCSKLQSIIIPDGVKNIGNHAFYDCSSLVDVQILEEQDNTEIQLYGEETIVPSMGIGNYAFNECVNLKSINIPAGIKRIGISVFSNCESLENITIPSDISSIGEKSFSNCKNLQTINIPEKITIIENNTFSNCESLTNIRIPNGVTSIGERSFSNCKNLQTVNIPAKITIIENHAFSNCESLTNIEMPSNVTRIGEAAFFNCKSLQSINIPESITVIENETFSSCESLESINIPNSVTQIGGDAFSGCINLQDVNIPEGVINIEWYAFYNCKSLTQIDIPASIIYIGEFVFSNCEKLEQINVDTNNTEYISENGVLYDREKTQLICYPPSKQEKEYKIPEGVTTIWGGAFENSRNLQNIDMPEGIAYIGMRTFANCENLVEIDLPNSLEFIDIEAFYNCKSLQSIKIPEGIITIQDGSFANCKSLTDIEVPDSLEYVTPNAFEGAIINKVLPNGTNEIEVPNILKRALDANDILYCDTFEFSNCTLSTDKTKIIVNEEITNEEGISISVNNGALSGLSVVIEKEIVLEIASETYNIQDQYILKILPKTTSEKFIENLQCNMEFQLIDLDGNIVTETAIIGTGYKLKISNGEEFTLIVCGDFTGDGKISIAELARASRLAVQAEEVDAKEKMIVDVSMDGEIKVTDLAVISRLALQ